MKDRPHSNIGVRLGEPSRVGGLYLHVIDVDIRDPKLADQARAKLAEIVPGYAALPTVISGSGGDSRHFYLLCEQAFRSKKLAHSAESFIDAEGKKHWAWEIELFGTGKQVAMPPSIHPSGNPYVWEREFDFDLVDMGLGPIVEASVFQPFFGEFAQGIVQTDTLDDDDDDLVGYLHKQPMDISPEEIQRALADLPDDMVADRDGWLQVGAAIHHQFQGTDAGLAVWNAWARRSDKFDEKDSRRVWKSFTITEKSLRFAFVLRAAADARANRELLGDDFDAEFDTDDDDEDLLGDIPTNAANDDDDEDLLGDLPAGDIPRKSESSNKPEVEADWVTLLDRNDEGAIKPTLHNLKFIIRNDVRLLGLMAFNLFTSEVVQRGMPGKKVMRKQGPKPCQQLTGPIWDLRDAASGDLWTEDKDDAVRAMIEAPTRQGGYGIKVPDRDLRAAINIVARGHSFHPVREYLGGLVWDGVPRLDELFIRYLGAEDNPYHRSVGRLTLVGGVARVMKPGHKFDFATILEGLQGRRKSTFIKILAKDWFSELDGDFHDPKQMVESMQGSWILEIPELSGFGKADVRQIKAFISRTGDKVRLAYGRRAQIYHRQCVLLGSTNDDAYLRDDTGARRFWPVRCNVEEIDTALFAKNVDQLWAEAVVVYNQMREKHGHHEDLPLYLTDVAARDEAAKVQEDRRVESAEDGIAGKFEAWLDKVEQPGDGFEDEDELGLAPVAVRNETCLLELWVECLGRDTASYGQMQAQQLGRAMGRLPGWRKGVRQRTKKYGQQRIYRRDGWLPEI